ncbi:anaphase-promoting complex subunit 2 [Entophlyctis luteolus]|nr:anaphase-promoting complex subunit 2 [Entophlyctis luteolus]
MTAPVAFAKVRRARSFRDTVHAAAAAAAKFRAAYPRSSIEFLARLAVSLPPGFAADAAASIRSQILAAAHSAQLNDLVVLPDLPSVLAVSDREFHTLCKLANESRIFELAAAVVADAVCKLMREIIALSIPARFDERMLNVFVHFAAEFVIPWVENLGIASLCPCVGFYLVPNFMRNKQIPPAIERFRNQIMFQIHKVFCDIRIHELFDMIVVFPESEAALTDFKICVHETDRYIYLRESFCKIISHRLLHLGASTTDIISIFVSSIKCLGFLDPSGDFLSAVSILIKKYLRTRSDAIRSVIKFMTKTDDVSDCDNQDDQEFAEDGSRFDRDHVFADALSDIVLHRETRAKVMQADSATTGVDVVSTLVDIFESQEVFVNEFQTFLAERLIAKSHRNFDSEVANVELLKKYFSEAALHHCDVMIKDAVDSKRITSNITSVSRPLANAKVNVLIISRLFWPELKSEPVKPSRIILEYLKPFDETYAQLKSMRTIRHMLDYGSVDLELEFADRTVSFSVTPAQASLIGFFDSHDRWSVAALADMSGKSIQQLERDLQFWVAQGVLKRNATDASYSVIENAEQISEGFEGEAPMLVDQDDDQQGNDNDATSLSESMKPFFPFINGMLTNFGALPVERMHAMLTQFAQAPKYTETAERLRAYLQQLVEEDICEPAGKNGYALKKK